MRLWPSRHWPSHQWPLSPRGSSRNLYVCPHRRRWWRRGCGRARSFLGVYRWGGVRTICDALSVGDTDPVDGHADASIVLANHDGAFREDAGGVACAAQPNGADDALATPAPAGGPCRMCRAIGPSKKSPSKSRPSEPRRPCGVFPKLVRSAVEVTALDLRRPLIRKTLT